VKIIRCNGGSRHHLGNLFAVDIDDTCLAGLKSHGDGGVVKIVIRSKCHVRSGISAVFELQHKVAAAVEKCVIIIGTVQERAPCGTGDLYVAKRKLGRPFAAEQNVLHCGGKHDLRCGVQICVTCELAAFGSRNICDVIVVSAEVFPRSGTGSDSVGGIEGLKPVSYISVVSRSCCSRNCKSGYQKSDKDKCKNLFHFN